ncbi:MAG: phosphotransferase family protein [Sphingobium sp.]
MQPSNTRLLQAVRDTLLTRLAPRLKERDALDLVGAMDVAICELLHREGDRPALSARMADRYAALAAEGERILEVGPDAGHAASPRARLAALVELAAQRSGTGNDPLAVSAWLADVLDSDVEEVLASNAPIAHGAVEAFDPVAFDHALLAADIGRQLGRSAPVRIDRIEILSGGFSRSTLAVGWSDDAGSGEMVVRRQKADGILADVCLSAIDEFPVIRFAHRHGLRVPEQYWAQPDAGVIGGPFIAMERARGRPLGSAMGAQDVDDAIMRQIAVELARLHRLPWREATDELAPAFGLPADHMDAERALDILLGRWKSLWDKAALTPSPAMSAGYAYLRHNRPPKAVATCLLHGDIGFHNLLFEEGRLTAWLDWETSFIGDPAKDLATCRSFVPIYTDWDRFLGWYRDAGGFEVEARSIDYYSVLRVVTQLIVGEMGWQTKFAAQARSEIEYLVLGGPVRSYFYNDYKSCVGIIAAMGQGSNAS